MGRSPNRPPPGQRLHGKAQLQSPHPGRTPRGRHNFRHFAWRIRASPQSPKCIAKLVLARSQRASPVPLPLARKGLQSAWPSPQRFDPDTLKFYFRNTILFSSFQLYLRLSYQLYWNKTLDSLPLKQKTRYHFLHMVHSFPRHPDGGNLFQHWLPLMP